MGSKWRSHTQVLELDMLRPGDSFKSGVPLQNAKPDGIIGAGLVPRIVTSINHLSCLVLDHLIRGEDTGRHLIMNIGSKLNLKTMKTIDIFRVGQIDGRLKRIQHGVFMANEIRRHGILDQTLNFWFETPVTVPLCHVRTTLEMGRQVIGSILPRGKDGPTESTARSYLTDVTAPFVHGGVEPHIVHQPQVLIEMIFPIEAALGERLLLAAAVIVRLQVIVIWISGHTEDTTPYVVNNDYTSMGGAGPLLQGQVQ